MTEYLFDTNDGSLHIGESAARVRLEQAPAGVVVPLPHLLELEELSFDTSEFEKMNSSEWTKEDVTNFGKWVLNLINSGEKRQALTRDHIARMYSLGLGPSTFRVRRHYPKMWELRQDISSPMIGAVGRFKEWTVDDFTDYAFKLAVELGRKPTESDFHEAFLEGKGPSATILNSVFGGIGVLNKIIGYPNIHKWTRQDYLNWGARAFLANKEYGLSASEMNELSKQKRGPSTSTVITHFGSLSAFQQLVYKELKKKNGAQDE